MNAVTQSSGLTAVDLTPRIGTEIKADVATLLSGRHRTELRELLERRGVLVFRQLNLDDEQQMAFTQTLGKLMLQNQKPLLSISLDKGVNQEVAEYLKGAFYWHIDMTTSDVPNLATLLTGRVLSAEGGDTEFANTYAAWDDLPSSEQKALEGLRVQHSFVNSQLYVNPEPTHAEMLAWRKKPTKIHPLVWTHKSGRRSLVLGSTAAHVVGMELEASRLLLCHLRDWATQPQFVYRHQWTAGDLVIWDNTGVMHRATPYPLDSGRHMRRTTIEGEEALA